MSAIRSRDNQTELVLRRALHAAGLRFRLHRRGMLGKPDLVFVREKVAVFVDGDFWHARELRQQGIDAVRAHIRTPTQAYWLKKFARRVDRDDEVTRGLTAEGWQVLRFWESDTKRNIEFVVSQIVNAVLARRPRSDRASKRTSAGRTTPKRSTPPRKR
jgi:DNA mismatch endonuclease (patch repair protein)